MHMMAKILVIDDDKSLALQIADALRDKDHLVDIAASGAEARAFLSAAQYDLLVLDWQLPDTSGPEICRMVRASEKGNIPVLFLTAMADLQNKIQGFESGADDYLTKPFHMPELMLRVTAILKRPPVMHSRELKVRDIVLDLTKHEAFQGGQKIELYPQEYNLLEFMISHPNQIFSADDLLRRLWSTDSQSSIETVRVTLMRIRQKIKSSEDKPLIVTLRNIGYRLEP